MMTSFSPDLLDFIRLLHKHAVRYVVVGGAAVIHYGYPRLTGDIDFFYDRTDENAQCLFACLIEFWNGTIPDLHSPDEFMEEGIIIQFGRPPYRIDLLNLIDGVDFATAWSEHTVSLVSNIPVRYIGKSALLANKRASARLKDLDDVEHLT